MRPRTATRTTRDHPGRMTRGAGPVAWIASRIVQLRCAMAIETFIVFAASYDTLGAAEADYHAVREFYLTSGLLDTYDAAVITRDDAGKVKIVVKHEQPTRQGAWRGLGIGLVGGAPPPGGGGVAGRRPGSRGGGGGRGARRRAVLDLPSTAGRR